MIERTLHLFWRALKILGGMIIGLCAILYLRAQWLSDDAPIGPYTRFIDAELAHGEPSIDFSGLNGGAWRLICMFGGNEDPIAVTAAEAAQRKITITISDDLRRRFKPALGARVPLDPEENAIAVISDKGELSIERLDGFPALNEPGTHDCLDRAAPQYQLLP